MIRTRERGPRLSSEDPSTHEPTCSGGCKVDDTSPEDLSGDTLGIVPAGHIEARP